MNSSTLAQIWLSTDHKKYKQCHLEKLRHLLSDYTKEKVLSLLQSAHKQGYMGAHLVSGKWPTPAVESFIQDLFDGEKLITAQYCKEHNAMSIFIHPVWVGIQNLEELSKKVYSFKDFNGYPHSDFCYDPEQ